MKIYMIISEIYFRNFLTIPCLSLVQQQMLRFKFIFNVMFLIVRYTV